MSQKTTTKTDSFTNNNKEQVWNHNLHLCVDVKTILQSDATMKAGKGYLGVLRRDEETDEFRYDERFTFREERLTPAVCKRNPHVFEGRYITITRKADGTLRPSFRQMPRLGRELTPERYATGVANELLTALWGLVGEE